MGNTNGRLNRLEANYRERRHSRVPWTEWLRVDAIAQSTLAAWPRALATWNGIVARAGMDREHRLGKQEWYAFLHAISCYGEMGPYGEAREAFAAVLVASEGKGTWQ
jgi:hypothetical protein